MNVGVLLIFQNWHEGLSDEEMFRGELRLAEMVEDLGFDSVWTVEHHFDDYSMCPTAPQILSYLAGRTSTITLGTAAVILPWNDPLRVAEKLIVLDHLSDGRVAVRAWAAAWPGWSTPASASTWTRPASASTRRRR